MKFILHIFTLLCLSAWASIDINGIGDSKSSSIAAGIGISGSKTTSDPDNPSDISNNIVSYKGSKLSSINANYSRSKSSTMVKQTVLSSITAKELNIEVGSNTDLKGSLIAAGYYDESGNFIDNGKLRLKTDSLTFSNLSNTRYDKSNSLSIGTNYAFKDPQQEGGNKEGESAQSKESKNAQSKESNTDPKSKISSINYANNRNLSYSMSKSLATIGKGELIVGDKDISSLSKDELASLQSDPNNKALYNSDDLTRLNRDSSKLSKELYSTKLNSNVDASVDMRLFSEGGRNEIKDELNRGGAITKSLEMLIKTGDLSFNKNVAEYANAYELSKAYGKDLSSVLMDEKVGIGTKEQVIKFLVDAYAKANGLNLEGIKVKLISDANVKGKNGNPFKGNFDSLSKTITLNLANTSDIKTFAQTLGHELSHAIDYKKGRFIPGGEAMNRYADIKGDHFADYLERGLDITGSKINLGDKLPSYDKYDKINKALLEHNLKNFNSTDKRWSDNSDINKLNPNNQNNIVEIMSKSAMDDYNPTNRIVYADHANIDKDGAFTNTYKYKNTKDTAILLHKEISQLDKYKNNPNTPIELSMCYIGGSDIQKELSLLEPNREIIAYEGYYATQLVYYMPILNPGSGKVIYRNGKVIYRETTILIL